MQQPYIQLTRVLKSLISMVTIVFKDHRQAANLLFRHSPTMTSKLFVWASEFSN